MADRVHLELVSPERLLLAVDADTVVLPGADGDFGVLADHAPLISTLRPGVIEVYEGEKVVDRLFVAGGVAEVLEGSRVTVLATTAVKIAEIERVKVEQALKDAREDHDDAKDDDIRAKHASRIEELMAMLESVDGP
jgi:F-type H+-transporting ATPase subunit epsilon